MKDGAPSTRGGFGSDNHGTLDQWRTDFPNAVVKAFGFSLGSGVLGDWVDDAMNFNGTSYTFANVGALPGKDNCKNGGWTTSTNRSSRTRVSAGPLGLQEEGLRLLGLTHRDETPPVRTHRRGLLVPESRAGASPPRMPA